ncbi:DUF6035 family protein [Mesorhizobium sp. M4A.F.Ca.ET.050.02.1.1]|uniref:DUF6035 family protein n=1 Tax=Mesorhizobium sp. M4A.F.Ca.ET.050.02.1.1 TaxID=2496754 RepID=UPI001FDFC029|nr:DUF6035 family protein [Mesorhizobium sp. M4A.F.Ca.ET.050.02.1.1]
MQTISSDELVAAGPDRYHEIRRTATRARNEKTDVFVCENCGYAVYAPREPRTRLPYWRHRKGAPTDCPWWTGDPSSIDEVNASQFQGAQESPLHLKIKNTIAELLNADPLTEPGSVVTDEYLVTAEGRRRPDVRAVYAEKPIAVEVQLATTQIPIIDARESFYEREGRHLIWLTWNFVPVDRSRMLTAFEDIFYSHNKNLFSFDEEVLAVSKADGSARVRAFWEGENGWESKVVRLTDLTWPETGLPFAVAPRPPWHEDFRARWLDATSENGTRYPDRIHLLDELASKLNMEAVDGAALSEADFESLLNCMLSFVLKRSVGSRQRNLAEVINTFLAGSRRHGFARLMRKVVVSTGSGELLDRASVQGKFAIAEQEPQDGPETVTGRIALMLFPELFLKTPVTLKK